MEKRNLIFYGDSNTYGYDPADLTGNRYPATWRWTTIVAEQLSEHYQVFPEGLNGRQLPDLKYDQAYLMRLIAKANDDGILCTMLGTNDLLLTLQPDAAIAIRKMEEYLGFLKRYLRLEQMIVIAPPLIGQADMQDPFYQRCYRESRKMNDGFWVVAEKAGVTFADASFWNIDLAYDHVHFSKNGHERFAEKMMELFSRLQD